MNGISLFAGVGGLDLGLREAAGVRTVCYVENNQYCQEVLKKRMREGWLDDAPIWSDICSFDGNPWAGRVDIVFGGFPCQDLSRAGKRAGITQNTRSGLFYEFMRVACEIESPLLFFENTSGIGDWFPLSSLPALDLMEGQRWKVEEIQGTTVVGDYLARARYAHRWLPVSAGETGNLQGHRVRWFCLAISNKLWGGKVQRRKPDATRSADASKPNEFFSGESRIDGERGVRRESPCSQDTECIGSTNFDGLWELQSEGSQQDKRRRINNSSETSHSDGKRGTRVGTQKVRGVEGFSWCEGIRSVEELYNRPDIPQPLLCGKVDGISHRMDRLKCLGNAVVPAQAAEAWRRLTEK